MEFNLKPCPFCGGEAKLYVSDGVSVKCPKCRAQSRIETDYYNGFEIRSGATNRVIDAWNRRVTDEVESR